MDVDVGLVKLLTEIGFMAGGHGRAAEAASIAEALEAARPGSAAPHIVAAVAQLNAGAPDEAAGILRDSALRAEPDNESARAFLGLALSLAGRGRESEDVLRPLADGANDAAARAMAQALTGTG